MTLVKLKWAVPVLATVISTMVIGCSSEPVVVEKIVEVEKVVAKEVTVEVVKEVVVTATPVPVLEPTATPQSKPLLHRASVPFLRQPP